MIRVGILSVPEIDERALEQIRRLIRANLPLAIVSQEIAAQNQLNWIEDVLTRWVDDEELSLIFTIGGTYPAPGLSNSEIVPEATMAVIERNLPGLSEAMRAYASEQTELALLDRGVAGIRSRTIIINLPAGASAASLFLEGIVDLIPAVYAHLNDVPSPPKIEDDLEIVEWEEPRAVDDVPVHTALDLPSESGSQVELDTKADGSDNEKAGSNPAQRHKLDPAEFKAFLQKQTKIQDRD